MNNPAYNDLLKWSIENSDVTRNDPNAPKGGSTKFDPNTLQEILQGVSAPSDAETMVAKMHVITDAEFSLDDKVQAFEDFEMLVGSIDNANNLGPLDLWKPLLSQLENPEPELRKGAAWCCGTAVENNVKAQERILVLGALPTLVRMATQDSDKGARKKAVLAISSSVRNFQPGLDAVMSTMPPEFKPKDKLDAKDMESVDSLITKLRANI